MDQKDDQSPKRPHDQEPINDTPQPIDKSDDDFLLQGQPEELRGSRLGDTRVRIELPQHPTFRRVSQGVLEATKTTYEPHTPLSRAVTQMKRVLIGVPLATMQVEHERLTKFKALAIHHQPIIGTYAYVPAMEPLSVFLMLRAFATGCSAMTGVEAISNGVPAFQKPETRNASITLTWMAVILGTLFLGITLLATTYAVEANPAGNPTVIAQIAKLVFTGPLAFLFPVFQIATPTSHAWLRSWLVISSYPACSAFEVTAWRFQWA